jgi:acyl carrier protein
LPIKGEFAVERILNILCDLRPDVDYRNSNDYIQDGLLSSLDIVSLVVTIEEEFSISIDALDIVADNFCNAGVIAGLIRKYGVVI